MLKSRPVSASAGFFLLFFSFFLSSSAQTLYKADGSLDSALYNRLAQTFDKATTELRLGPSFLDLSPKASDDRPTLYRPPSYKRDSGYIRTNPYELGGPPENRRRLLERKRSGRLRADRSERSRPRSHPGLRLLRSRVRHQPASRLGQRQAAPRPADARALLRHALRLAAEAPDRDGAQLRHAVQRSHRPLPRRLHGRRRHPDEPHLRRAPVSRFHLPEEQSPHQHRAHDRQRIRARHRLGHLRQEGPARRLRARGGNI